MFRPEAETALHAAASRADLHEEPDPAVIRWMPVFLPLSAALVLGMVATVWGMVL
jgi:hypothetical protein